MVSDTFDNDEAISYSKYIQKLDEEYYNEINKQLDEEYQQLMTKNILGFFDTND